MLIELSNARNDGQVIKNYIQRLREGGWKHYIGSTIENQTTENYHQGSFFVCNFSRGIGMTITHLRDASENTLGATFNYTLEDDFKTYILLSWGTHIASHNCMNLKATEPENFE